jgi:hypothetical protein
MRARCPGNTQGNTHTGWGLLCHGSYWGREKSPLGHGVGPSTNPSATDSAPIIQVPGTMGSFHSTKGSMEASPYPTWRPGARRPGLLTASVLCSSPFRA